MQYAATTQFALMITFPSRMRPSTLLSNLDSPYRQLSYTPLLTGSRHLRGPSHHPLPYCPVIWLMVDLNRPIEICSTNSGAVGPCPVESQEQGGFLSFVGGGQLSSTCFGRVDDHRASGVSYCGCHGRTPAVVPPVVRLINDHYNTRDVIVYGWLPLSCEWMSASPFPPVMLQRNRNTSVWLIKLYHTTPFIKNEN